MVNFVTGKPRLRATEEPKEVNKPQREIVLRGAVNQINESLEHLLYVGDPDFFGNDKIDLIAKDTKDRSAQNYLTIEVDIKGIDDLPMVAGPSETKDVMEDHFLSINEFKIVDPDVDTGLNEFYDVRVVATNGKLRFNAKSGLNFTVPYPESESIRRFENKETWYGHEHSKFPETRGVIATDMSLMSAHPHQEWWSDVTVCGILADINNAIHNLTFLPNTNWNSERNGYSEILMMVQSHIRRPNDAKILVESESDHFLRAFINVKPKNDAPVVNFNEGEHYSDSRSGTVAEDGLSMTITDVDRVIVNEDSDTIISARVRDVDDDVLTVEIVANMGYISLLKRRNGWATCAHCHDLDDVILIDGTSDNTDFIVFQGTLRAINTKLGSLSFRGRKDFHGNASLEITACDASGLVGKASMQISVIPVEDIVELWVPVDASGSTPVTVVDEGSRIKIGSTWLPSHFILKKAAMYSNESDLKPQTHRDDFHRLDIGRAFFVSDRDGPSSFEGHYHAELIVSKGSLSIANECGGVVFLGNRSKGSTIQISGDIHGINCVAKNIVFTAGKGESGDSTLSVRVSDGSLCDRHDEVDFLDEKQDTRCDASFHWPTAEASLKILIVAVNSSPEIIWIGDPTVYFDVSERRYIGGFKVTDDDMNGELPAEEIMKVDVFVTRGDITLSSLDGLSFVVGDGYEDKRVEFYGGLADINVALRKLKYGCDPARSRCGLGAVEELTVQIDDNGFTGKGPPLKDEAIVQIRLKTYGYTPGFEQM